MCCAKLCFRSFLQSFGIKHCRSVGTKGAMSSKWKPPTWMHKANASDTDFLEPRKLNHGKLFAEKEEKSRSPMSNAEESGNGCCGSSNSIYKATTDCSCCESHIGGNCCESTKGGNCSGANNTSSKSTNDCSCGPHSNGKGNGTTKGGTCCDTTNDANCCGTTNGGNCCGTTNGGNCCDDSNTGKCGTTTGGGCHCCESTDQGNCCTTTTGSCECGDVIDGSNNYTTPGGGCCSHSTLVKETRQTPGCCEQDSNAAHSILAVIQIQEFEELFEELFEAERDKIRLIVSTSSEIDLLRQRIIELCGETMKHNPSQQSSLRSFLSLFSFGQSNSKKETGVYKPITKARFSNPEAMEERIQQIKRSKLVLVQETAKEIEQLRNIIRCLEHINHESDQKRKVNKSTWSFLWWLLAAVVIGFTIPAI